MQWYESIILGIIQGLTEFLPVSSSGHIELGKAIFGHQQSESLLFSVVVHFATALSTVVVFRRDIGALLMGLLRFQWNEETVFTAKLVFSMIPVGIAGVLFKDEIESLFTGNILLVGSMLLVTGLLLAFSYYKKPGGNPVNFGKAFAIGLAQAIAIIPGISRSGATISTALLLGVDKDKATRFSFLMVLFPIFGASLLEIADFIREPASDITTLPVLFSGFFAAFLSGLFACSLMIRIVRNGKLIYFAIYCFLVGITAITLYFI